MKKLWITVIVLALVGGGAYYYYATRPKEKPQIVQAAISQGDIVEAVQATGTLDAVRDVLVGSQVSGVVSEIDADYNSIVHKDQVIARLDPALLNVQVEIAQSNVDKQVGQIKAAEITLVDGKRQLARIQQLFDKKLENQADLDAATLTVQSDATNLDAAQKQLIQNQANLDQAKLNVDYCTIKAPIDGVVVARNVDVGQTVQQSMSVATFFDIATDLTKLKLTAGVDEADIGKIRPKMPVQFNVDAYQNQTFNGTVNSVRLNATTTNNVVTYPVWIDAANDDLRLRPSMTANARIIVSTATNAIKIPNQALRFKPTADMYASLGLTPPATPTRGGGAGRGANGQGADANNGPAQPGAAPTADQTAARGQMATNQTPGNGSPDRAGRQGATGQGAAADARGGRGQGGRGGPGGDQSGQGRGGRFANMTPEQRAQMMAQGGRGRGFGQGQMNMTPEERARMQAQFGARGNQPQQQAALAPVKPMESNVDKIDDLYPAMVRQTAAGTVYLWDGTKLSDVRVRVGVTDGQFTELASGDLKPGQQVVTGIVIPVSQQQRNAANSSLFGGGQQGRGGLQPGGPGGGPPGGGFGGGPGR